MTEGSKCANDSTANAEITNCKYQYGTKNGCFQCNNNYILNADGSACVAYSGTPGNCSQLNHDGTSCKKCKNGVSMINQTKCLSKVIYFAVFIGLVISIIFI